MHKGDRQWRGFWNPGTLVQILQTSSWFVLSRQYHCWRHISCCQTVLLTPSTARVRVGLLTDKCLTRWSNFCLSVAQALSIPWLSPYNTPFLCGLLSVALSPHCRILYPSYVGELLRIYSKKYLHILGPCTLLGYY